MHKMRLYRTGEIGDANFIHEFHGASGTPEHIAWLSMKSRCKNPKHPRYKDWGGRGIKVCDRWNKSFSAFLQDVGFRPSDEYSIDRIDNDGNYEPGNVKWSTVQEQTHNRRARSNELGITGVQLDKRTGKYVAHIWDGKKSCHVGVFDTPTEAHEAHLKAKNTYTNRVQEMFQILENEGAL